MKSDFVAVDWLPKHKVGALMCTRNGGLGASPYASNNLGIYVGDDCAQINRRQLRSKHQLPSDPLWLKQVHGVQCVHAQALVDESLADAVWSDVPNQVLAIQTADCLPVLFADKNGAVVAAAHAGWRGLVGGVLENTLTAMPVPNADIHCWLGTAIGPCCFEVGDEVRDEFLAAEATDTCCFEAAAEGKWLADLYQLARRKLQRAGVAEVSGGESCTTCNSENFFSYRRDGGVTGRMATLIWRL